MSRPPVQPTNLSLTQAIALGKTLIAKQEREQKALDAAHCYYVDYPHIDIHKFKRSGTRHYCDVCGGHRDAHCYTAESVEDYSAWQRQGLA